MFAQRAGGVGHSKLYNRAGLAPAEEPSANAWSSHERRRPGVCEAGVPRSSQPHCVARREKQLHSPPLPRRTPGAAAGLFTLWVWPAAAPEAPGGIATGTGAAMTPPLIVRLAQLAVAGKGDVHVAFVSVCACHGTFGSLLARELGWCCASKLLPAGARRLGATAQGFSEASWTMPSPRNDH